MKARLTRLTRLTLLALAALASFSSVTLADAPADPRATPPAVNRAPAFSPPPIKEARLANGIRVILVERHEIPLVAFHVTSSLAPAAASPGVAAFAADVAFDATDHNDGWELNYGLTWIGAKYGAAITADSVDLTAKCVAPHVDRMLELLADVTANAAFDQDDVDKTRTRRLTARHHAAVEEPFVTMLGALYPAPHPAHDSYWGSEASITTATPDALKSYWHRAFVPSKMTIVVVGDATMDTVMPSLTHWFGGLHPREPETPAPAIVLPPLGARTSVLLVNRPGSTQSKVVLAARAVPFGSPDFAPLSIVSDVIEDRLMDSLRRELGYTYGVGVAVNWSGENGGALWVSSDIETAHTADALAKILEAIDRPRTEPVTDAELARTKDHQLLRWPTFFTTAQGTASTLAAFVDTGVPVDMWTNFPKRVDAVTKDDVKRVAATYLDSSRMPIVIIGDARAIRADLEKRFGAVTLVKP
jgi:predicted Zn-dependent peptidase